MHQIDKSAPNSPNAEWAIRSENWISELAKSQRSRRLRERNPNPLILSGHGISMRVEKGTLVIREGFSHYPQKQITRHYFPGDLDFPRLVILLDGSGTLSFDVLNWLSEQGAALVRIKWTGESVIVSNGTGHAADQAMIDWQRETRNDPKARIAFAKELIARKLQNSIETLCLNIPESTYRVKAIDRAKAGIDELSNRLDDMQQIRAIEGESASAYFRAWTQLKLRWKAVSKYPIPDHWKSYRARSSVHECKPENRRASDPVNAMLNYAYAVKLSQLQIEAVGSGYHPMLGIMHHEKRGKPAYTLDLLEPERPQVDAAILGLIAKTTFSGADFILRKDGTCRLSPQLARVVASSIH